MYRSSLYSERADPDARMARQWERAHAGKSRWFDEPPIPGTYHGGQEGGLPIEKYHQQVGRNHIANEMGKPGVESQGRFDERPGTYHGDQEGGLTNYKYEEQVGQWFIEERMKYAAKRLRDEEQWRIDAAKQYDAERLLFGPERYDAKRRHDAERRRETPVTDWRWPAERQATERRNAERQATERSIDDPRVGDPRSLERRNAQAQIVDLQPTEKMANDQLAKSYERRFQEQARLFHEKAGAREEQVAAQAAAYKKKSSLELHKTQNALMDAKRELREDQKRVENEHTKAANEASVLRNKTLALAKVRADKLRLDKDKPANPSVDPGPSAGQGRPAGGSAASGRPAGGSAAPRHEAARHGPVRPPTARSGRPLDANSANDSARHTVSNIVDRKMVNGAVFYRVKWGGYEPGVDTWEPESILDTDVPSLIAEYNRSHSPRPAEESDDGSFYDPMDNDSEYERKAWKRRPRSSNWSSGGSVRDSSSAEESSDSSEEESSDSSEEESGDGSGMDTDTDPVNPHRKHLEKELDSLMAPVASPRHNTNLFWAECEHRACRKWRIVLDPRDRPVQGTKWTCNTIRRTHEDAPTPLEDEQRDEHPVETGTGEKRITRPTQPFEPSFESATKHGKGI